MTLAQQKLTFTSPIKFDSPSIWISKILRGDGASIVQIGSNDGVHGDPLHELIKKNKNWKALFVEPVPYLFEKLKKTYGSNSRFTFKNVAINDGSQQIFYSVREEAKACIPQLPNWYDQLGSFNKDNIVKHLDGVLEPYIEETVLTGLTLRELFKQNNIQEIDLLHIDTEGHDWKILSQLDLDKYNPSVVLYEHKHLSEGEIGDSINFLKRKYSIFKLGGDFICLNKGLSNEVDLDLLGKPINTTYHNV